MAKLVAEHKYETKTQNLWLLGYPVLQCLSLLIHKIMKSACQPSSGSPWRSKHLKEAKPVMHFQIHPFLYTVSTRKLNCIWIRWLHPARIWFILDKCLFPEVQFSDDYMMLCSFSFETIPGFYHLPPISPTTEEGLSLRGGHFTLRIITCLAANTLNIFRV